MLSQSTERFPFLYSLLFVPGPPSDGDVAVLFVRQIMDLCVKKSRDFSALRALRYLFYNFDQNALPLEICKLEQRKCTHHTFKTTGVVINSFVCKRRERLSGQKGSVETFAICVRPQTKQCTSTKLLGSKRQAKLCQMSVSKVHSPGGLVWWWWWGGRG